MERGALTLCWSLMALTSMAQWNVPARMVLDGVEPVDRQVTGLTPPQNGTSGVSADVDRTQELTFAPATGVNELSITLPVPPSAYLPGLRITIRPVATNTGPVSLDVNGLGSVPVLKNLNVALDSGDLRPGIPLDLIHDGAAFQITTQLYPGCPSGYWTVNTDVCIEATARDTTTWYAANNYCYAHGARMCGVQEWLQGCLKVPQFLATVTDYEWVDSAAQSNTYAKTLGWTDGLTSGDCRAGSRHLPTGKKRFRCCYDR